MVITYEDGEWFLWLDGRPVLRSESKQEIEAVADALAAREAEMLLCA